MKNKDEFNHEQVGEIDLEIAKRIKRQAGKIVLCEEQELYSVGSAGYFRDKYIKNKTLLWQKSAPSD